MGLDVMRPLLVCNVAAVSGCASLSSRRYGSETASRWRFPNGTAMVGTISTSMAFSSLLSVSRYIVAVSMWLTFLEEEPKAANWTSAVPEV